VPKSRILPPLHLQSVQDLYRSYMPFVQNGGIFVPTEETYPLGEQCLLNLKILDEDEIPIMTRVVWVVIPAARHLGGPLGRGRWRQGVGLGFTGKEGVQAKALIEKTLGRNLASTEPTLTF
jgi:type IV pilus assembly protein PilZ